MLLLRASNLCSVESSRLNVKHALDVSLPKSCRVVAMEGLGRSGGLLGDTATLSAALRAGLADRCDDLRGAAALAAARLLHDARGRAVSEDG